MIALNGRVLSYYQRPVSGFCEGRGYYTQSISLETVLCCAEKIPLRVFSYYEKYHEGEQQAFLKWVIFQKDEFCIL